MEDKNFNQNEVGKAKQSGWAYHYSSLSGIKDECSKFGTLARQGGASSIEYLKAYLNHVYTFGQQIFCFYNTDLETKLTNEWLELVEDVNTYISEVQNGFADRLQIPLELITKIVKYFNKLMRLAKDAGLLIDQDDAKNKEPTKGGIGLR
jgi:hypothetical protein